MNALTRWAADLLPAEPAPAPASGRVREILGLGRLGHAVEHRDPAAVDRALDVLLEDDWFRRRLAARLVHHAADHHANGEGAA